MLTSSPIDQTMPPTLVRGQNATPWVYSVLAVVFVLGLFTLATPALWHWSSIPIGVSGVLVSVDAFRWLAGRLDTFDPKTLLSLFGIHALFIAPLLHLRWQFFIPFIEHRDDWSHWFGLWAFLNVAGLIGYRMILDARQARPRGVRTVWRLRHNSLREIGLALLAIGTAVQIALYLRFGGIGGYIAAATERISGESEGFRGLGLWAVFAESTPLVLILIVVARKAPDSRATWTRAIGLLLLGIALQVAFGGLRGTRSNIVFAALAIAGLLHGRYIRIRPKHVAVGLLLLIPFVYFYSFFKIAGVDAVQIGQQNGLASLEDSTGRTLNGAVVHDLARADVQALLVQRSWGEDSIDPALGRTYVGAAALMVPRSIWPNRPPGKRYEGTVALFGEGAYERGFISTRVYGLAGEGLLNFGPFFIPVSFLLLAVLARRVNSFRAGLHQDDSRHLILPLVSLAVLVTFANDSNNVLWFLVRFLMIPLALIFFSSTRQQRSERE